MVAAARNMGWLVGTSEEIRTELRAFAEAGVQRIILGHYNLRVLSMLEILG